MNPDSPVRVLIVDDHAAMRVGLRSMLATEKHLLVVGAASSGSEALDLLEMMKPDIVLLDLRMRGLDGIGVMLEIKKRGMRAQPIVLSSYETDEDVYQAVRAGARGYLLKDAPEEELGRAIDSVFAGGSYFPHHIAARLADRMIRGGLSSREIEVLEMMAAGLTNKEIGGVLNISSNTVRCHVTNITTKLDASDRTEAVTVAIRYGLIRVE